MKTELVSTKSWKSFNFFCGFQVVCIRIFRVKNLKESSVVVTEKVKSRFLKVDGVVEGMKTQAGTSQFLVDKKGTLEK